MEKPRILNVKSDRCQVWVIVRCCAVWWVLPDVSKNRSVFIFRGSSTLELFKRRHSIASQNIWTPSNTTLEIPNPPCSRIIACTTLKDNKFVPLIKDYFLKTCGKMYVLKEPSAPELVTRIRSVINFKFCSFYHQERNAGHLIGSLRKGEEKSPCSSRNWTPVLQPLPDTLLKGL
jgi:hypothetical protein